MGKLRVAPGCDGGNCFPWGVRWVSLIAPAACGRWGSEVSFLATAPKAGVYAETVPGLLAHLWDEAARPDRQAREALYLTFNVSLEFFETRLLGISRAAGAAVTVVADANHYAPNSRAISGAGKSYVSGLAATPGAFHPKVTVVAGPERALIGIGSGNLTVNGWHRNEETLTLITADPDHGCPAIVTEVIAWLRGLPDLVPITRLAADGIRRTAAELERLTAAAPPQDTGHRLVTTSGASIIDQLPVGHVDRLELYAPFHDPQGAALGALLTRYRPKDLLVAVQPGLTVIDPHALQRAAASHGANLTFQPAGEVYRHGKLLQAVTSDGAGWTLTGSPNLTAAALLRPVEQFGNCEVGVLAPLAGSLYPGQDDAIPLDQVPTVRIDAPGEENAKREQFGHGLPVLLGAVLNGNQLDLQFAKPLPAGVVLEASRFEDLPEQYVSLGVLPAGRTSIQLPIHEQFQPGTRLHVLVSTADGPVWGPDIHLTDPVAVLKRVSPSSSGRTNVDVHPGDLFGDPGLAEAWQKALAQLLSSRGRVALPRAAMGQQVTTGPGEIRVRPAEGWHTVDSPDVWARYTDDAAVRLGNQIADFAIGGLPKLTSSNADQVGGGAAPIWFDRFADIDPTAADDEHTAEEIDALEDQLEANAAPSVDHRAFSEREKARYRRWLHTLANLVTTAPAIDRSAMVGLILIATDLDIWDSATETPGWFDLLADAVRALPGDDVPEPLTPQLGSLAAVCLFRLDEAQPASGRTHQNQVFYDTRDELRELIGHANPDAVAANCESLGAGRRTGTAVLRVAPAAVWEHRNAILRADGHADALKMLQRNFPTSDVKALGPLRFEIRGDFTNPVKIAAQAITLVDELPTVAVDAVGRSDKSTLIRHDDTLTHVTSLGQRTVYKTYRLTRLVDPVAIASNRDVEQSARIDRAPWMALSSTAQRALDAVARA